MIFLSTYIFLYVTAFQCPSPLGRAVYTAQKILRKVRALTPKNQVTVKKVVSLHIMRIVSEFKVENYLDADADAWIASRKL